MKVLVQVLVTERGEAMLAHIRQFLRSARELTVSNYFIARLHFVFGHEWVCRFNFIRLNGRRNSRHTCQQSDKAKRFLFHKNKCSPTVG
jgi:hypothetical protein